MKNKIQNIVLLIHKRLVKFFNLVRNLDLYKKDKLIRYVFSRAQSIKNEKTIILKESPRLFKERLFLYPTKTSQGLIKCKTSISTQVRFEGLNLKAVVQGRNLTKEKYYHNLIGKQSDLSLVIYDPCERNKLSLVVRDKYIFICNYSIPDILNALELALFLTLSKLDIPWESYRVIETYVIKLSFNYKYLGVLPQGRLAPKDDLGNIKFVEFLRKTPKVYPSEGLFSPLKAKNYNSTLNLKVDSSNEAMLKNLGIQLYALRQVYSLPLNRNVYFAMKTCGFISNTDHLEILQVMSTALMDYQPNFTTTF